MFSCHQWDNVIVARWASRATIKCLRVSFRRTALQRAAKLWIIFFFVGLREEGSRVIARLVVQSRGRAFFRIPQEKPKNRAGSHNEVGRPFGKRKTLRNGGGGIFVPTWTRGILSYGIRLFPRNAGRAMSSSEKPKNHTRLCGQRALTVLCRVAKEISLLGDEKKKGWW